MFLAMLPILYLLLKLILSGQVMYITIGSGIVISFYVLLKYAVGMSTISNSSDYGSDGKKTE